MCPVDRGLARKRQSRMRREPVVSGSITWVGMDVHKKAISIAALFPGQKKPTEWTIEHNETSIRRLVKRLQQESGGGEVRACYEAGPCGYALQRRLAKSSIVCEVIAPSLVPVKPGDRIKTDRRDARKQVFLLQAGMLTEVHPPTEDEESIRDVCRCREDAKEDLHRARHRLVKMLLRRGIIYAGGRSWTDAHRRWLNQQSFESRFDQVVFDDYKHAVEQLEQRLAALDEQLEKAAEAPIYREQVGWLRCFRGIDTVTALTILAELHGIERFASPRQLSAYLGLVPCEHSSGESERRGSITKAGNGHVRRALVEAAWHYRHKPGVGKALSKRRKGQPSRTIAIADAAQQRLYRRFRRFDERGKTRTKIAVAIARELAGFIWAALNQTRPPKKAGAVRHEKEKSPS